MFRAATLATAFLLAASVAWAPPASAGCGCDHAPPDWTVVMPPFGAANKRIEIFAVNGTFTVGEVYDVDFGTSTIPVVAAFPDMLEVTVPGGVPIGPLELHVQGPGYDYVYPSSAFTVLGKFQRIKNREGAFRKRHYKAAVSADGTLYLPINVKNVLDAMQFAFSLRDLPLAFGADDVAIYNADGVDLSLFTLDVNTVDHQWGSYYGWSVETDAGLTAQIFKGKARKSDAMHSTSDIFTYWRHEFHTYKNAHMLSGSHQVDPKGYHPDGTLHIDHYNLVIAIDGVVRDFVDPEDLSLALPLTPGMYVVNVGWLSVKSDNPVEVTGVAAQITSTDDDAAEALEDALFDDDDD